VKNGETFCKQKSVLNTVSIIIYTDYFLNYVCCSRHQYLGLLIFKIKKIHLFWTLSWGTLAAYGLVFLKSNKTSISLTLVIPLNGLQTLQMFRGFLEGI